MEKIKSFGVAAIIVILPPSEWLIGIHYFQQMHHNQPALEWLDRPQLCQNIHLNMPDPK